jgi:hypothetical protein
VNLDGKCLFFMLFVFNILNTVIYYYIGCGVCKLGLDHSFWFIFFTIRLICIRGYVWHVMVVAGKLGWLAIFDFIFIVFFFRFT